MPRGVKITYPAIPINDRYSIGADEYNVILYEKSIITGEGASKHLTKKENIGKAQTSIIGYFATIKGALHFLLEHDLRQEDMDVDFKTLIDKVEKLHQAIDGLPISNAVLRSHT